LGEGNGFPAAGRHSYEKSGAAKDRDTAEFTAHLDRGDPGGKSYFFASVGLPASIQPLMPAARCFTLV